ncbi:hypothetical protein Goklo_012522 [Gossypium klotzschianum]|uniref:Uncharacterized protein n=1 Tax=Gossypium klotzschianum TaxID=34286 RepID=A0A7J8VD71_9ROSI|nr:hypothetical protein [Gossypium klotzschianum]
MDRGCGSILELWDVARYLKLNCGSFWTSISHNSSSLESAKEGQDTSHCPGSQCVCPKQVAESTTCYTEEHLLQGQHRDRWG